MRRLSNIMAALSGRGYLHKDSQPEPAPRSRIPEAYSNEFLDFSHRIGADRANGSNYSDEHARAIIQKIVSNERVPWQERYDWLALFEVEFQNNNSRGMANPIGSEITQAQYDLMKKNGWLDQ